MGMQEIYVNPRELIPDKKPKQVVNNEKK